MVLFLVFRYPITSITRNQFENIALKLVLKTNVFAYLPHFWDICSPYSLQQRRTQIFSKEVLDAKEFFLKLLYTN